VQSHFRRQEGFNLFTAGKTVTVRMPIKNVVDTSAVRRFAHFRNRIVKQLQEVTHAEE